MARNNQRLRSWPAFIFTLVCYDALQKVPDAEGHNSLWGLSLLPQQIVLSVLHFSLVLSLILYCLTLGPWQISSQRLTSIDCSISVLISSIASLSYFILVIPSHDALRHKYSHYNLHRYLQISGHGV